ncbi:hypothetical protein CLV59_10762 [Chitinophaga dinghuensis]|uniref:Uncharacterized protein n=1 Tax=Chitinophaga dinghuensis TaxID=1539050 RepID=A0A327VRX6_9BACT|nr:hypothetical protein [Chitinophaga dinghuensis]RAJ77296.1 hypothetical protein CLV59_10762 [Chitinophaga dinghuensis]
MDILSIITGFVVNLLSSWTYEMLAIFKNVSIVESTALEPHIANPY